MDVVCMPVEAAKKAVEVAKKAKVGGITRVKKCDPTLILSEEERKEYKQWGALCKEIEKRTGGRAMSPNRAGYYAACYEMLEKNIINEYDMTRMVRFMDEMYCRSGLRWSIRDHVEAAFEECDVRIPQYKKYEEAMEILEKYTKLLNQKSCATLYWEREKRKGEV